MSLNKQKASIMIKNLKLYFVIIFSLFILTGCALFTSYYDATRHENFTKLQAFHVKFINDFTANENKKWDADKIEKVCDTGDLKYREALVYAQSKDNKDATGARAVSILKEQFEADCGLAQKRKKNFSNAWAGEHLEQILKNYAYAISGELSRLVK